jgi:hypothetical protein
MRRRAWLALVTFLAAAACGGRVSDGEPDAAPPEAGSVGPLDAAPEATGISPPAIDAAGPIDASLPPPDSTTFVEASAAEASTAEAAAVDAAVVDAASEAGPPCGEDLAALMPADEPIRNSDATIDGCYSCIVQTCPAQLAACNADCSCVMGVIAFVGCLEGGGDTLACGTAITNQSSAAPLVNCIAGPLGGGGGPGCLRRCGVVLGGVVDASAGE